MTLKIHALLLTLGAPSLWLQFLLMSLGCPLTTMFVEFDEFEDSFDDFNLVHSVDTTFHDNKLSAFLSAPLANQG